MFPSCGSAKCFIDKVLLSHSITKMLQLFLSGVNLNSLSSFQMKMEWKLIKASALLQLWPLSSEHDTQ